MAIFYLIIGIIAGIVGANMAKKREQNPALWFVVCFLFPIAILGLLFIEKKNSNNTTVAGDMTIYTISSEKTTFAHLKNQINDYCMKNNVSNIIFDNEKIYLAKSENSNSVIQLENKNDKFNVSLKNINIPEFLKEYLPDFAQKRKENATKLVELGNMLEKGLISQEEFESMKKDLI